MGNEQHERRTEHGGKGSVQELKRDEAIGQDEYNRRNPKCWPQDPGHDNVLAEKVVAPFPCHVTAFEFEESSPKTCLSDLELDGGGVE